MPTDWPDGVGHVALASVDSTLNEAARSAAQHPGPTWFTAAEQTAARGRRGRAWVAPRGNFFGTLALPLADPADAALRSFVAALALRDALATVASGAQLSLKWPNDVLLSGGKVAGILLESLTAQNKVRGVAIGIGVNLIAAPDPDQVEPGAVRPVSVLGETGFRVTPEAFLNALAPAYARWEATLTTHGFAPIRQAWLNDAARLGEVITARLPTEEITGTFETLDASGYLVLSTPKGRRSIAAADVYF